MRLISQCIRGNTLQSGCYPSSSQSTRRSSGTTHASSYMIRPVQARLAWPFGRTCSLTSLILWNAVYSATCTLRQERPCLSTVITWQSSPNSLQERYMKWPWLDSRIDFSVGRYLKKSFVRSAKRLWSNRNHYQAWSWEPLMPKSRRPFLVKANLEIPGLSISLNSTRLRQGWSFYNPFMKPMINNLHQIIQMNQMMSL